MQNPDVLQFKRLHSNAVLPKRGSSLAAGYDITSISDMVVTARSKNVVPTGWSVAIPVGCYGRMASRSGLSVKNDLEVGAGVIDSDYRGEIKVILRNHSDKDFQIKVGDRVAQLIIEKISTPEVVEVSELTETQRGDGGFGSTGIKSVDVDKKQIEQVRKHFDNCKLVIDDTITKTGNTVNFKCSKCQNLLVDFPHDGQYYKIVCANCNNIAHISFKTV